MVFWELLSWLYPAVELAIAFVLMKSARFTGRGWIALGLAVWAVNGLLWRFLQGAYSPDLHQTGSALGLAALVIGVVSWYLSGRAGGWLRGTRSPLGAGEDELEQGTSVIPRTDTNSITQAENLRDRIYGALATAIEGEDIPGEVYRSPPFSPRIWIRIEIHKSVPDSDDLSLRASGVFLIEPREFHRFEHEIGITLNDSRKIKRFSSVIEVTSEDALRICRYLAGETNGLYPKPQRCRLFPWEFWLPKNKLARLKPAYVTAKILLIAAFVTSFFPPLAAIPALAAAVTALVERLNSRRILSLTPGKPRQEPRHLLRMDSWQAVLQDLGPRADSVAASLREALAPVSAGAVTELGDAKPAEGGYGEPLQVGEEDIWYQGIDGKVERRQIVVRLRRTIGFIHVYPYGDDLYVGWDAHLNGGTWVERLVGRGREAMSGRQVRAYGIQPSWHTPHEYDITDANFLLEGIHAAMTKVVKRVLKEHEIDQEIDFTIVREARRGLAGSEEPGKKKAESMKRLFRRTG